MNYLFRFRVSRCLVASLVFLSGAAACLAVGGTTTDTTSTTSHTTTTNVTVDQRTSTGVVQNIIAGGDQVNTVWNGGRPLSDRKVQSVLNAALATLRAQLPPFPQGASLQLLSRTPGSGGSSSTSSQISGPTSTEEPAVATFGPGSVHVGPNRMTLIVLQFGDTNVNINTNNEFVQTVTTTLTGGAPTVETYLQQRSITLDLGAVFSTLESGLPILLSQRESLVNAHSGGIGDVNGRIFRLWLGDNDSQFPQGTPSTSYAKDGKDAKEPKEVAAPEGTIRGFVSGSAGWLSQDSGSTSAGLDDTRESGTVGAEWTVRPQFRFGVAATYVHSETDFSDNLGTQKLNGGALSVYATWRGTPWFADLLYSVGLFENSVDRNTLTGGTARSSADAWSHLVSLNTGYIFKLSDTISTGPYLSLTYVHGDLDGTSEHGGGSANLRYDSQSYDSLVSTLGWQGSWKLHTSWGAITPLLHVGWERENLDDTNSVSARLLQSPFSFSSGQSFGNYRVQAERESASYDALSVGAAVNVEIGERWTVSVSVDERTDFGSRNDFSCGLRTEWKF